MAHTLRSDAIGLVQALAIGIAGSAPSYTIAVSSAVLVATVGPLAPAALLYCGLLMAGITSAFVYLNRAYPDAGASYAWVGRVLHRDLGFLCGWVVLMTSVLFTVSATIPAATATLLLLAPDSNPAQWQVTAVAAGWIVAITLVEVRGMRLTGVLQAWITAVEVVVLAGLALAAAATHWTQIASLLTPANLSLFSFTPQRFAAGAVVAVFFFWGWDVPLNASEETRRAQRTPGLAAALAMLVVACAFIAFALVTLAVLSEAEIRASGTDIVFAIAEKLVPRPWCYLAVLAVMLSSVGSLQVSLLQFARTLFSVARSGEMNPRWAQVHVRWRTPHLATWLNAALGLALLLASLALPGIDALIALSINAIGLEIAFYYGLAAIACAWHFRREAARSPVVLLFALLWPLASALALFAAAAFAALDMNASTLAVGLGGIAIGLVPLGWARARRSPYEQGTS